MKSVPCPFGEKNQKGFRHHRLHGWLAVHSLGYFGICIANPIAWGLALLYCVFMVTRVLKKENA